MLPKGYSLAWGVVNLFICTEITINTVLFLLRYLRLTIHIKLRALFQSNHHNSIILDLLNHQINHIITGSYDSTFHVLQTYPNRSSTQIRRYFVGRLYTMVRHFPRSGLQTSFHFPTRSFRCRTLNSIRSRRTFITIRFGSTAH